MSKVILRKPRKFHSASYRCHGLSVLESNEIRALIDMTVVLLKLFRMKLVIMDYMLTFNEIYLLVSLVQLIISVHTK